MKEALKRSWWKLPLYCLAAGWVSYQIQVRLGPILAVTRLPDGTVTIDSVRWMVLSAALFLAVLLAGGLGICRRMTRQEVFASATVLVAWNVVTGLASTFLPGPAALFLAQLGDWTEIIPQLLSTAGCSLWFGAVVSWAAPWLFIPFGQKAR